MKPITQASMSGLRRICRRIGQGRNPFSEAKAALLTNCTKGTISPEETAPSAIPGKPNMAPATAKPIRLLKRMPPMTTLVIAACGWR